MSSELGGEELANLRKLCRERDVKLEAQNQEIYNQNRELNRLKCLEAEYLHLIETLTLSEKDSSAKHEAKVRSLEDKISRLKEEHLEHVDRHKLELQERDSRIEELQNFARAAQDSTETDTKLIDGLNDENTSLKDCVTKLSERIEELTGLNEELEKQHALAEDTIIDLRRENAELHESYTCKEEELHEANCLVLNLQEENALAKNELDLVKSEPSDGKSQGNSLFAEVDDRRLQLQQTITEMKAGYKKLQAEKGIHLRQISELQLQVATLCQRWENEAEEKKQDDEREENSYKSRIGALEALMSSYKQEIADLRRRNEAGDSIDCVADYVKTMTANKNKEIEEHRMRISDLSSSRALLCCQIKEANAELRKWKADVTRLRAKNDRLQTEIEKLKLDGERTVSAKTGDPRTDKSGEEMSRKLSYIDVSRQTRKSKADKENVDRNPTEKTARKAVQFREDVLEPKITDRDRLRRGGKIMQVQSIHIPSVKKKAM